MTRPAFSRALALFLLVAARICSATDDAVPTPAITAAPVFIPYYSEDQWAAVRGSIISENKTASETTYTIFCPTDAQVACDLSLEFPFIIVEGPRTLKFHGTLTSTYIADLECKMNGTTAATCSGYSSYRSGYTNGKHTGPTEVSWTSTLTGTDVVWGTLTLATKPAETDNALDVTGTNIAPPTAPSTAMHYSWPTQGSAATRLLSEGYSRSAGVLLAALAAFLAAW
ncbi:hypothetical protein E4U40_004897 [Claviceps sp. LM458 group G5]|nr:hypothetical protein E4U40_004897 [Claviceps sp. LM458 group G5]